MYSMVGTGVGLPFVSQLIAAEEGWAAIPPTFFRPFSRMKQEYVRHAHETCEGLHGGGACSIQLIVTREGLPLSAGGIRRKLVLRFPPPNGPSPG